MGTTKKRTLNATRTTEIVYASDGSAFIRFHQFSNPLRIGLAQTVVRELTTDADVMKLAAAWHLRGEILEA